MIEVYDRQKKVMFEEKVLAKKALEVLYGDRAYSKVLHFLMTRFAFFSRFVGYLLKRPRSKKKIAPFIREFSLDEKEFLCPVEHYSSFNDFFIRELKPEARPLHKAPLVAPADGRYLAFPCYDTQQDLFVKGQHFSLYTLLGGNLEWTQKFREGPFLIARLCPTDYHRFHFPAQGIPSAPTLIKGRYQSVNPIALCKKISILTENKRMALCIKSDHVGDILFVAVGATNVGSIQMTYLPHTSYDKGAELGYFSFGASMLLLFFEPGKITFAPELIEKSAQCIETYIRFGEEITLL